MAGRPKLVGIVGNKYSGKSTLSRMLCERFGYTAFSLGDPLKDFAQTVWDFSDDQIRGLDRERIDPRYGISPRYVLQRLGNDITNMIDPKALVHRAVRYIGENPHLHVVIDDLRHPTQSEFIEENDGEVWRIVTSLEQAGSMDSHSSEDLDWIMRGKYPRWTVVNEQVTTVDLERLVYDYLHG